MKKLWIFVFTMFFLFCGCDAGYNRHSAGASSFDDAIAVVQMGVPYVGGIDLRLDKIELLETDNYGRNLFLYTMASSQECFLLIVQKTEGSLVYYYENYCYAIYDANAADNEEIKNRLKEQNDWNTPTNDEKAISVDYTKAPPDHENIPNYLDVCKEIQTALELTVPENTWESSRILLNGLELYPNYGQIIFVEAHNYDTVKYYIALYDYSAETAVVAIEPIDDSVGIRENIIRFKEKHCAAVTLI